MRQFAEAVLADGKSRGRMHRIGNMSHFFGFADARRRGFNRNEPIYITDEIVMKYVNHPKAAKKATVPIELMNLIGRALKNPKNIYRDLTDKTVRSGAIVFVTTIPKEKNKVIKVVVHTDYSRHGKTYHLVKSFGIVKKEDMNSKFYQKLR